MAGEAHRRLYFALWPDDALRSAIVRAAAPVVAAVGGRAVPPADLHVTLAFLGAVPPGRVPVAIAAARGVRAERGAQTFDSIRTWPRGGPLVLDASRVAPVLARLQSALQNALLAADFTLDRRDFRPHITLARAPERRRETATGNACSASGHVRSTAAQRHATAQVEWRYSAFVLVESRTAAAGCSRYAVIESFELG